MKTIHARQIQLTKMRIRKTKRVLYIVSNIFSHHIAHTFLPQLFDSHHFTTHIYPSRYTPLNNAARSCHHCCGGKVISIIHYECVFVALGTQREMRMRRIVCHLWPVRL